MNMTYLSQILDEYDAEVVTSSNKKKLREVESWITKYIKDGKTVTVRDVYEELGFEFLDNAYDDYLDGYGFDKDGFHRIE